ncbi:hypothetical protein B0H63DRAFT_526983 [Podospora didyma]|uniref:Uncharacterized protein n=1 Tax=Podospora didyma TaxID=330526 RepID=A0AAE0K9Q3_9PEZI|nr:hypothetical protein B0H63DRAFT_526983 [Podospora didyma]
MASQGTDARQSRFSWTDHNLKVTPVAYSSYSPSSFRSRLLRATRLSDLSDLDVQAFLLDCPLTQHLDDAEYDTSMSPLTEITSTAHQSPRRHSGNDADQFNDVYNLFPSYKTPAAVRGSWPRRMKSQDSSFNRADTLRPDSPTRGSFDITEFTKQWQDRLCKRGTGGPNLRSGPKRMVKTGHFVPLVKPQMAEFCIIVEPVTPQGPEVFLGPDLWAAGPFLPSPPRTPSPLEAEFLDSDTLPFEASPPSSPDSRGPSSRKSDRRSKESLWTNYN